MNKGFSIAIDGPVGSGKGTVSEILTNCLHAVTIYSGGYYRGLAFACMKRSINIANSQEVLQILYTTSIQLAEKKPNDFSRVFVDSTDVTEEIMNADVAASAPFVSKIKEVRVWSTEEQKKLAEQKVNEGKIVVVEGRNSVAEVLPHAAVRIFLTAALEVRAHRRYEQYQKRGSTKSFEEVLKDTKERDEQDMTREVAPMPRNPEKFGYTIIDNTKLTIEQTAEKIIELIQNRVQQHG